jgi:hypothetical protein
MGQLASFCNLTPFSRKATVHRYRLRFGADYFGFWAGGCRCLVLNSSLHVATEPEGTPGRWVDAELMRHH